MRKSFTRLISIFMLIAVFGFQAMAIPISSGWDGENSIPKAGDLNVKPADIVTQFVVAFSAAPTISATGGTMAVYKGTSPIKVIDIKASNANVKVVGKTLVITHGIASFAEESNYRITLSAGAVTVGGNSVGALDWNFGTGDFTAPKLATTGALAPTGTHEVATMNGTSFNLVMKFDETVLKGKGNIAVYQENGTVVELIDVESDAVVVSGADNKEATITVSSAARFLPQTKYYVRVAAGAFTDDVSAYGEDAVANVYAGITNNTTWTFTTRDTSAPEVTLTVTDVTKTSAKLNVTLSEAGSFKWFVGTTNPTDLTGFTNVTGVAANTAKEVSVSSLTGGTTYYAYVVASNSETPPNATTVAEAVAARVEFKTGDNTGPVYIAKGTVEEDNVTTGAFMIFDEQVKGGTGTLSLRRKTTNELIASITASAVTSTQIDDEEDINDGKWKAIFDFNKELISDVTYYIVFPNGFITDMSGNVFAGNYTAANAWEITGYDNVPPVVSFSTTTKTTLTASNITGAGSDDAIYIHFDEEVFPVKHANWSALGNSFSEWTKYVALKVNGVDQDCDFEYTADKIVITPNHDLQSNTVYTVILRDGVAKDENDNLAAGKTITVTAGDNDAAEFSYGPSDLLVEYTPLTIEFTKDVFVAGTPNTALTSANLPGLITVSKNGTAQADADFDMVYDAATKTITVTPKTGKGWATSVAGGTPNNATLALTATTLRDSKNGTFTGSADKIYTIADYKAPTVTLRSGDIQISAMSSNATVTYNEAVTLIAEAGAITPYVLKAGNASGANLPFTVATSGNVVTLSPNGWVWEIGKTYYYGVGSSMKDGAGNVIAATYKTFTVVPNVTDPVVKAVSYTVNGGAANAIDVVATGVVEKAAGGITFVVTFDQAIDDKNLAAVNTVVTDFSSGNVTIASGNIDGSKLTIEIPASVVLGSAAEYTIEIPANLIEGNATYDGTHFAQFAGVSFKVKSKDITNPTVTIALDEVANPSPIPNVAMDAELTLTFSEPVSLGSGAITIKAAGATTNEQSITISGANIAFDEDNMVATVKTVDFVKYNTVYTVTVPKAGFVDGAANNLGAADITGTFRTIVNPQPEVAVDGLYPADDSDLVPYTLDLTMTFTEPVVQASTTGSRKLVYVIEKTTSTSRASIDEAGDLQLGGDVQTYYAYVDETAKVGVSGNMVTIKGVTLVANKEYYVLITPGAFKDKSAGVESLPANPVPGEYAGITEYGIWNFHTGDVIPAEASLEFTKLGADGLPATDSDIKIVFTKAIVKANGTAIANVDIATLFSLTKGESTDLEFTGTISADKKTVTISNSSLVLLGEMKGSTGYTVSFASGVLKSEGSGDNLGAWNETFITSDYTAPTKPVIAFDGTEIGAVYFDTADDANVHTAKLTLSDASEGDAVKFYYFWTADVATALTKQQVKDVGTLVEADDMSAHLVFAENMASKTQYKVVAVAEDAAGNLSDVTTFTYTTDDVVAPELASALPTTLGSTDKLKLVFNEDVVPASGAFARIIDANGVTYSAPLSNQVSNPVVAADKKTIVIDASLLPIADDVASYTVEIDPGMIVDVPRKVSGTDVNTANAFAGILGAAFTVTSDDEVAPVLLSFVPMEEFVDLKQSFTLTFSEPVNLKTGFTSFVVYELFSGDPYDIVTAADITGVGTSQIVISPIRELESHGIYYIVIPEGSFVDLAMNPWVDTEADFSDYDEETGEYTFEYGGQDEVPLEVDGWYAWNNDGWEDWTGASASEPLDFIPTGVGVDFDDFMYGPASMVQTMGHSGPSTIFFLDANQSPVNTYELKDHIYFKEGDVNIDFELEVGGDWIDIIPSVTLEKGKTYTYGFVNLYDWNGNLNAGEETSFTIAEDAPENVYVTFTPGDNDGSAATKVNISVNQIFTVEFNGVIFSYDPAVEADNNLIMTAGLLEELEVFTMNGAELEVVSYSEAGGKSVVTLQATEALESETAYTLTVNGGVIQIRQGHNPLSNYGPFTETFMTADVDAPKLIAAEGVVLPAAYLPNNGGIVGKSETLALVFDEEVVGAGSVEIHRWDGVLVATVDITGVESTDETAGWVIELANLEDVMAENAQLVTNNKYYVIIPAGAIVDMAAVPNSYAGINVINEWKFDLRDDAKPSVTFVQNMMDNVAVNTKIDLTFDREVVMDWGWLAIYEEVDGDAVQLIRIDNDVQLTVPSTAYSFVINELAPNTKYYVELGKGSFVSSAAGVENDQIEIGDWWFTTEVDEAPVAIDFQPAKAETVTAGVMLTTDLVITFDQNVVAGTGNIQLHNRKLVGDDIITSFNVTDATKVIFSGNTVTIPAAVLGLVENSEYYVIVPGTAIRNNTSSPEYWEGVVTPLAWSFSTVEDGAAPKLLTWTPNATTVLTDNHPTFVMTFDEEVVLGENGGNLVVTKKDATTAALTIPLTAAMIGTNGKTVTVTYVYDATKGGLDKATDYFVTVTPGAFEDATGNAWEGVTANTTWTFKTGADFATDVPDPINGSLEFTVYPNPFDGYVNVTGADKLSRIILTNVAGQRVKEIVNPTETIQTSDLRSGLYFITLVTKDGVVAKTERIVKK